MQQLAEVLSNFLQTRARLGGKATRIDSPDQQSIFVDLPEYFRRLLVKMGRLHEFEIEGSVGNGNMSRVPWVAIFNKKITTSAQEGYYIVLLFSEDMSGCFLSLNQGVTEMGKQYTRRLANKKMVEAAVFSLEFLSKHPEALYGVIDLHATLDLGRGYEFGAIESFYYRRTELPTEAELEIHFLALLSNYDSLFRAVGNDLKKIAPITEAEFQDAVLEKASSASKLTETAEGAGGMDLPEQKMIAGKLIYPRNPSVAARALRAARFACELDNAHWTFESRAAARPYVEAHHLIPMNQQSRFAVSLDVEENIVCLCATCHRMLHFGHSTSRNPTIKKLLDARIERLASREISVSSAELLNFYSRKQTVDE